MTGRRTIRYLMLALLGLSLLLTAHFALAATLDDDTGDDDAAVEEVQALLRVTGEAVGLVHSRMFGNNLLAGYTYGDDGGGMWDPQGAPCSSDVVGCYKPAAYGMLSAMRTGLLRFPGGRMARHYQWQAGVGPAIGRDHLFGTDEFLYLARVLGSEPVITVGLYDPETGDFADGDTITAAAQWVEYVNFTSPYGPVTYWEVDFDTWENTTSPYNPDMNYKRVPPEAYADAFLQMSMALKAIDPSVKVGAVAYEQKNIEDTYRMLARIVDSGADPQYWPDFLTMNFYQPNFDKNLCNLYGADLEAKLRQYMSAAFAASHELVERVEDAINAIDTTWGSVKADIPILLSEYNTQLLFAETITNYPGDDDAPECPFRNLSHSLGAAIYNADILMNMLPYADDLLGAAIWNFMDNDEEVHGYYGSVYLHEGQAIARPNELVLEMLGTKFRFEEIYPTSIISPTFDNDKVGNTPAYQSISIEPDENYIRVRVIRYREPVENSYECGPDNSHNPDPNSTISGIYHVDNFSLIQDDLPPDFAINLLTNGDFEQDLSTGWQQSADPPGVTTRRDCDSSDCWLEVRFANTPDNNPAYLDQIMQTVAVEPGERYSLRFDYRMQNLQVKTQNLLCDPSWEFTSTAGPYANDYWLEYGSTPAPAIITSEGCYDGVHCVMVPIEDNPDYYHIRQRVVLVNDPSPELADPSGYRVQGYILTDNLDGAVTIEAQARNVDDQYLQSGDTYGVFGDSDWQFQNFRFQLNNRNNTAFVNVHLRRKAERKDQGFAMFDNVRMYRDETVYAPRIAVDVCQDADCTISRTITTEGVLGTRPWAPAALAGTPIVTAVVGRAGDDYNIVLINKDLDRAVSLLVDLGELELKGERIIFLSRLGGDALDADNELVDGEPDLSVALSGGEYFGTITGSSFTVDLPPYTITGLKLLDSSVVGNDDMVNDDTLDDDVIDDDVTDDDADDDDDVDVDDDAGDEDDEGDGGDGSGEACGC